MKNMSRTRRAAIIFYLAALLWYLSAILAFAFGSSDSFFRVFGLLMGSSMLCLGSANMLRANKENEDEDEK